MSMTRIKTNASDYCPFVVHVGPRDEVEEDSPAPTDEPDEWTEVGDEIIPGRTEELGPVVDELSKLLEAALKRRLILWSMFQWLPIRSGRQRHVTILVDGLMTDLLKDHVSCEKVTQLFADRNSKALILSYAGKSVSREMPNAELVTVTTADGGSVRTTVVFELT